ncbi:MAG: HEAT repeat domain-containing protein [Treponema sp.]|nr:HEAT repeat domain-containing protein [Treponema sp.]
MNKRFVFSFIFLFFSLSLFCEDIFVNLEETAVVLDEVEDVLEIDESESSEIKMISSDLEIKTPLKKRPKPVDKQKSEEASKKDESIKTEDEYRNTIKFGIASEISDLVDKLVSNDDPRFADDLYDLFQITRSVSVKEKILNYFKNLEDPCLEDFACTVLDDPFEQKNSTVKVCFQYIQTMKTKAALPAVLRLIENENEDYFNDALLAVGEIGGSSEAVMLTSFLENSEFSDAKKQNLMKALGKIHAVETWDKLCEVAKDEDENLFVRMYAAEAIGAMGKLESVPILVDLYESSDPNLRQYALKGLEYFPDVLEAKKVIVQAVRDDHYKVRLEAIGAVKNQKLLEAVPYLIYRAKNDPEEKVKLNCFEVLAVLNTKEGNEFLISRVTERKVSDSLKSKAVEVLLKEGNAGKVEIKELCIKAASDDKLKVLRQALGKHISKYPDPMFDEICIKYLESKDNTTQSQGLEMYQNGKYDTAVPFVRKIAEDKKANSGNKKRARRLLGLEEE